MFGDPPGEVAPARMAARELRYPYRRGHDRRDARRRLHDVVQRCAFSDIPRLRLARTLDTWREELLAYFTTGRPVQQADRGDQPADQADQAGYPASDSGTSTTTDCGYYSTAGFDRHLPTGHPDPRPHSTLSGVEPLSAG